MGFVKGFKWYFYGKSLQQQCNKLLKPTLNNLTEK